MKFMHLTRGSLHSTILSDLIDDVDAGGVVFTNLFANCCSIRRCDGKVP